MRPTDLPPLPAAPTNGDATAPRQQLEGRAHSERQKVLEMLDDALGTELAAFLRYRRHHFASPGAGGVAGFAIATELLKHSQEELANADRLAARITQLGGAPDFRLPAALVSAPGGAEAPSLRSMLNEDLAAERLAVNSYATFVRIIDGHDPTSRRLFEDLLSQAEVHVEELEDFLRNVKVII